MTKKDFIPLLINGKNITLFELKELLDKHEEYIKSECLIEEIIWELR